MLDHLIGSTTPDVCFLGDQDDADNRGVCIYLDGLGAGLHGDPAPAAPADPDREIRSWLSNNGYQVIEIGYVELDDRNAMVRHFQKLDRFLQRRSLARRIEQNQSWFDSSWPG